MTICVVVRMYSVSYCRRWYCHRTYKNNHYI